MAMRDRYRADGEIDAELYTILRRLAFGVVFGTRLPPTYSPNGTWDRPSVEDALQGWITRRLLQTGALLAAFDHAEEPRPFLFSLERNFRHYLENERMRGELGNLISRTHMLLSDEDRFKDWVPQKRISDTWWGLAAWEDPVPYQGSDDHIVAQAWALGEIAIFRYSQDVGRASPILSRATLLQFLTGLYKRVGILLTISHLAVVYRRRFDLGPPIEVEINPEIEEEVAGGEEVGPEAEAVKAAAIAAIAELSARQIEAVIGKLDGETLEATADRVGISRGTVDNDLRAAGPVIDKHCGDGIDRHDLLEKVIDALSKRG